MSLPAQNPPIPPLNPKLMAPMGAQDPFASPAPAAVQSPPSASLPFQIWAGDPRNTFKVQSAMTPPDQRLQPNAPPQQPASSIVTTKMDPAFKARALGQNSDPNSLSGPMAFTTPNKTQLSLAAANPPRPQFSSLQPPQLPSSSQFATQASAADPGPAPTGTITMPQPNVFLPPTVQPRVQSQDQARLGADQALLDKYRTEGAGVNQIKNPVGRFAAKVGDIVAPFLLGGGAMAVPGLTAHNLWLQNRQQGRVNADQEALNQQIENIYKQAQTQNLLNPRDKFTPIQTDNGYAAFDPSTGTAAPVMDNTGNPLAPPAKETAPHFQTMPDGSIVSLTQDKDGNVSGKVVYKGDPNVETQIVQLQKGGRPHQVIVNKKTGAELKDLGESGEKPESGASYPGSYAVTGDDFLETLPAGLRAQVKAMANGDIAIPPAGTRNPQAQQLRTAVLTYDPTYTDARYKGKQNFKTSGDAQNIVQLSTAMEHADHALTNSGKVGFAPMLGNKALEAPESAAYMQDAEFLTGEVGKLVKNGVLTVDEGDKISSGLTSARQGVRDAALKETMDLLGGKARAVFQKYKTSTGQDLPLNDFFDAKAQQRLVKYGIVEGTSESPLPGNPMQPPPKGNANTSQMPPQSVIDSMTDGQYTHSPDGTISYQKVNGKLVQVNGGK